MDSYDNDWVLDLDDDLFIVLTPARKEGAENVATVES